MSSRKDGVAEFARQQRADPRPASMRYPKTPSGPPPPGSQHPVDEDMYAQTHPAHRAMAVARVLHSHGMDVDHPAAQHLLGHDKSIKEMVRRWHARMAVEAAKLPQPPPKSQPTNPPTQPAQHHPVGKPMKILKPLPDAKSSRKFHPPDPSALGSG